MFQFMNKVNHIFAHGAPVDAVNKAAVLVPGVLCFHFFNYLFAERTNFRRTRNCHIFITFIPSKRIITYKHTKCIC